MRHLTLTKRQFLGGLASAAPALWLARTADAASPTSEASPFPKGSWDRGTVIVEGTTPEGRHVKRAYSWSPTGYVLVENGDVLARWGRP